jgi:hypothetical protein
MPEAQSFVTNRFLWLTILGDGWSNMKALAFGKHLLGLSQQKGKRAREGWSEAARRIQGNFYSKPAL